MYISANGIQLFYKKQGSGPPLILLHGNGEDCTVFDAASEKLKAHFSVYAVDTRGHGRSEKVKALHYTDIADDIFCFIQALGLERPVVYGFSDGGIAGLLLAATHPSLLSALIVSGANANPHGLKTGFYTLCKIGYFFSRADKVKMMLTEPHITDAMLRTIDVPTFVTCGEKDIIRHDHTLHIANTVPHATLQVFAGESHGGYVVNSTKIADYILSIL